MTPWTVVLQASLSMEFSRLEHWSGLPFPSPADLRNPGTEPGSLHCRQILCQLDYKGVCSCRELQLSSGISLFF